MIDSKSYKAESMRIHMRLNVDYTTDASKRGRGKDNRKVVSKSYMPLHKNVNKRE